MEILEYYEVCDLTNPRKCSRILHIDMLKPVTELEQLFKKTHCPGYEDFEDHLDDEDLVQLFAEGSGPSDAGTVLRADQECQELSQPSEQKMPVVHSQKFQKMQVDVNEGESESRDIADEDLHIVPQNQSIVSEHAEREQVHSPEQGNESEEVHIDHNDRLVDTVVPSGVEEEVLPDDHVEASGEIHDEDQRVLDQVSISESDLDLDASESSTELEDSLVGIGNRLPVRNRRRPDWFGNPISYVLWGEGHSRSMGQITHL